MRGATTPRPYGVPRPHYNYINITYFLSKVMEISNSLKNILQYHTIILSQNNNNQKDDQLLQCPLYRKNVMTNQLILTGKVIDQLVLFCVELDPI